MISISRLKSISTFNVYILSILALVPITTCPAKALVRVKDVKRIAAYTISVQTPDVTIHGTLTIPNTHTKNPVVILISGSGSQDRDGFAFGHRPFRDWSDYLVSRGIAVLRYDDRAITNRADSADNHTSLELAADVSAIVSYLTKRADIDPSRIGLVGHSEGAIIASLVASNNQNIDFLVLLGAPAVNGYELFLKQKDIWDLRHNVPPDKKEKGQGITRQLLDAIKSESEFSIAHRRFLEEWRAILIQNNIRSDTPLPLALSHLGSRWSWWILRYDPKTTYAKIKCPTLAIWGELDQQVPPEVNLPLMNQSFNHNAGFRPIVLRQLNHNFQSAVSGHPDEYETINESVSPVAFYTVGDWIDKITYVHPHLNDPYRNRVNSKQKPRNNDEK